jgi:hypothetical protein
MRNEDRYHHRGIACGCPERKKPAQDRKWVITQYRWNSGAFTAGEGEWSSYSSVRCLMCGGMMRTKARYVDKLDLMPYLIANPIERGISQDREKYENWTIPELIKEFTTL